MLPVEKTSLVSDEAGDKTTAVPTATVTTTSSEHGSGSQTFGPSPPEERLREAAELKERGNAFFKAGEFRKAAQQYRRVFAYVDGLVAAGSDMQQYATPGNVLSKELGERVLETKATTWKNLANVYLRTDEPARALECADKALALVEKDAKAHLRRGQALLRLKRWDKAKTALLRADELQPNDAVVRAELARWQTESRAWREEQSAKERQAFGGKLL